VHSDSCSTVECVSGDWSSEVEQEDLSAVKQEPDDVCLYALLCYVSCVRKNVATIPSPLTLPNNDSFFKHSLLSLLTGNF